MAFRFDSSGVIQAPTREELEAADARGESLIVLDQGKLQDGTPYWAYVAVKPSKYSEFMQLGKTRQPKRIGDYGAILKYGFEEHVPEAARKAMKEEHGFDEDYEAKMTAAMKAERTDFLKKQETQRIGDIVAMLKKKQGS